ncbi:MAG TPA: glycosyltransferase family A protein [Tepidiformaceae bacterium]|nr:glycosyltransferase family A protein [Tepidiformaceae bacterium]
MTDAPATPSITVIIPVKDDARVDMCLETLQASLAGAGALDAQVIVVNNNSAPAFREHLEGFRDRITLLHESRPGAYAARNAGLDVATGDLILLTDADCLIQHDWVAEAIHGMAVTGADILLGSSGQVSGMSATQRLIHARGAARLRRLRPGQPTEIDTKNLAVRRHVFDRLRFNGNYRRAGDTEFGLVAESLGFRVAYWPRMHIDHDHDTALVTFVAKQISHGWGAQRIMAEHPEIEWHGGHLRLVARVSRGLARIPFVGPLSSAAGRAVVLAARATDALGTHRIPFWLAYCWTYCLDKGAAAAGHLMHAAGTTEPSVTGLLGRPFVRD